MFYSIFVQPLANGLVVFYRIFGSNLGLAIIMFTLFLRVILSPLTKPYMNSMKKMKDFAPQIDKLKKKYAGDKIKFAKAQADFYKENKINPSAGCLPYLVQIIILIAFFNVFTRTISTQGNLAENFNKVLYEQLRFKEGEVVKSKFLYLDITKPEVFNIPGIPFPIPGPIILLSAIAQFLSSKAQTNIIAAEKKIAQKTKSESDDFQVTMQKSMIYTFPLMTILIGVRFASGLALYWLVFSVTQLVQQIYSQGWGGLTPWINKIKLIKS